MCAPQFANLFHKVLYAKRKRTSSPIFVSRCFHRSHRQFLEFDRVPFSSMDTRCPSRHLARLGVISSESRLLAGCLRSYASSHRLILMIEPHTPGVGGVHRSAEAWDKDVYARRDSTGKKQARSAGS